MTNNFNSNYSDLSSDKMTSKTLVICVISAMLVDISLSTAQQTEVDKTKADAKVLSRRKRFLIFPTGSSFSVATCMTVGVYGKLYKY